MSRVAVLGCGRVGSLIVNRLTSAGHAVSAFDSGAASLEKLREPRPARVEVADLSDPDLIRSIADDHDLVVGALPGHMGLAALEAVVETGKPLADISFLPEDPLPLDARAKETGSIVVYDIGVAPGLSHLLVGCAALQMDGVEAVKICVGGLPLDPRPPFHYAAPFSPIDVLEEYTRPARFVRGGEVVECEALSEIEVLELPGIDGPLEAFLTDGLRSLIRTVRAREMVEKTIRWPGHAEKIRLLRDGGFFSTEKVSAGDGEIVPLEATAAVLFPRWELREGETEFTVMRVEVTGTKDDRGVKRRWDVLDFTDRETGETSMARTTGLPCVFTVEALLEGRIDTPGVHPPEALASAEGFLDDLLSYLRGAGVRIEKTAG